MEIAYKPRGLPVRFLSNTGLILLAAVLVFAVTFTTLRSSTERKLEETYVLLDAQALLAITAIDSKIEAEALRLRNLVVSEVLVADKLEEFYIVAKKFADQHQRQVVLFDIASNRQVINTSYPFGMYLKEGMRFLQREEAEKLKADRTYVSNLFYAPLAKKMLVAIAIPILEGDRIAYLLGVAIDPVELYETVKGAVVDAAVTTALVDRRGVVLARSKENEKFAGRTAPSNVAERPNPRGRMKGVTFDGAPINISYVQSELSGWAASALKPDYELPLWPAIAAFFAALMTIVICSLIAIAVNARRRRRPASVRAELWKK